MKKYNSTLRHLMAAVFTVMFMVSASAQTKTTTPTKTPAVKAAEYKFTLPPKDKSGEMKENKVVTLDKAGKTHLLKLGTFTTPMSFIIMKKDATTGRDKVLLDKEFAAGEDVVLDITGFEKTVYTMMYTANGQSCQFPFAIE